LREPTVLGYKEELSEDVSLIRSSNHSTYPRTRDFPLESGDLEAEAQLAVAEQSRSFVDIVTDGLVRWRGPLSHFAAGLDGVEWSPRRRRVGTSTEDEVPTIVGRLTRKSPVLLPEYRCAVEVGPRALKMVLPGPLTFARVAEDRHYGSLEPLVLDLAAILAQEVGELTSSGCRYFRLEEPCLTGDRANAELAFHAASLVFGPASPDALTILSTSHGALDMDRAILARVPTTHLGLDMIEGPENWGLLDSIPEGSGVFLGLFDARRAEVQDASEVFAKLEPHRDVLMARDVIVGPHAGLDGLSRDEAFEHLLQARYLVESLIQRWGWRE
jgi:5-methyltetrahydropteroyltriglutamate--homocysteine methyltransferase